MLFNSYIYLLLFLPLCLAGFHWLRNSQRHEGSLLWLNLCSLAFYAWWNPVYLPLLLASIAINFQFGKWLATHQGNVLGKKVLVAGITLNLAALAWFKYSGLAITGINAISGLEINDPGILLPLAISFFTFNQIAYLVDAYDGMTKEYRFNHYSLFVTFFPHLLAGPIVHHRELIPQFFKKPDSETQQEQWAMGITAISIGLFKKVILADALSGYANQVFNGAANGEMFNATEAWIGALSFTLQVYFDFSGYCDIACGSALLFGITLPQNFLSPFKTANIIEFWKHWHITLSRFITSYIYTPLMRNTSGGVAFSKAMLVTVVSMGLSGLWHGAGLTFVAWGLAHGVMLVINHSWRRLPLAKKLAPIRTYKLLCVLLTYIMVTLTMVFFRSHDIATAASLFHTMFNFSDLQFSHHLQQPVISDLCRQWQLDLTPMQKLLPVLVFMHLWVWLLPNLQQMIKNVALNNVRLPVTRIQWQANTGWSLLTAATLAIALMAVYETGDFVYFQF